MSEVSVHSGITLTPSGTDINLISAFTTATYNNLQRHWWSHVWSPARTHALRPTTLHLCGVQVAACPVEIWFHCRCSVRVLASALLDSDPGAVKCLTCCVEPASD